MYTEVLKASFHRYPRFPKGDIDRDIKPLLLTFTDASQSTIVVAYMAYTDKAGKLLLHMIYAKGGLCSTNQTVPKRELQGMTNGAEAVRKIKDEMADSLGGCYNFTDSEICLHWQNNQNGNLKTYCQNRVDQIRETLLC